MEIYLSQVQRGLNSLSEVVHPLDENIQRVYHKCVDFAQWNMEGNA